MPGVRHHCGHSTTGTSVPGLQEFGRGVDLVSMDFDFAAVLARMVEVQASDVHLTAGAPPSMRDKGKIIPMEGFPVLSGQETREVVYSILNDDQRKRFETGKQLDFAYAIPGVARFRVNCFFQRGAVSAAFRLVPQDIPSLDSLKVPQVLRELCAKPRGFVLVTGPTGSGKSTTLAAMIDVINSENQDHILTIERLCWCRNSIGSSIVRMWSWFSELITSIIAARVVDLPEPVGPVTSTKPRGLAHSSRSTCGTPSESRPGMSCGTRRKAALTEPRWKKQLTRKRATPGIE